MNRHGALAAGEAKARLASERMSVRVVVGAVPAPFASAGLSKPSSAPRAALWNPHPRQDPSVSEATLAMPTETVARPGRPARGAQVGAGR